MERKLQAICSSVDEEVGGAVVDSGVGEFVVGFGVTGATVVGSGVAGATVVGSGVTDTTVVGFGVAGATVVGFGVAGANVVGSEVTGATVVGSEVTGATVVGPGVRDATILGPGVAGGVTPAGFGRYRARATTPTTRRSARKQLMAIHPRDTGRSYHFLGSSAAGGGW